MAEQAESFQAQWDYIILKREVPTHTKGGILLTENTQKILSQPRGTVISMGPSAGWLNPKDPEDDRAFEVGDEVIVGKLAGDYIKVPDEKGEDVEVFICKDVDVLAKVVK